MCWPPAQRQPDHHVDGREQRAEDLIAALPARAWRRFSVGAGAHGPREYDWARIPIRICWGPGRGHWLLARRSISRPDRDRLLRLLRTPPRHADRSGLDRRGAVADRGMLPTGQERGRPGPLPGPHLAGLVRPHHPVHARPRLARRDQTPHRKRGTGVSDTGMIGFTLPETPPPPEPRWSWVRTTPPNTSGPGRPGAADDNTKPASATTNDAATHSSELPLQY